MSEHPTRLLVTLASPALFTGPSQTGTNADTDIVTDSHGLPQLPRHRLNARLREGAVLAARSEHTDHAAAHVLTDAAVDLFGSKAGHELRNLRVGHARLPESVRAAVAWAMRQRGGSIPERLRLARAVTEAYTGYESGTEVDADGAPVDGRLRTNRALRSGLRLEAELRWAVTPTEGYVRFLARAVLATTTAGARVTRGRGRLSVALAPPGGSDPEQAHAHTVRLAGFTPAADTPKGEGR
ncbi:hypothetical protein [Salinactinospora qingdaonensis]|uniref:Uncharacterized protein n=1 Tax=Salinactinospora qingdaonensis TaxID=702744 RepID=A0ABP7FTN9_9ACTN